MKIDYKSQINKLGGKAVNLSILSKNNFEVPKFFVISTGLFQRFIKENNLEEQIKNTINKINFENKISISRGSKQLQELFIKNRISTEDKRKILLQFNKIKKDTNSKYFAVRSSAVDEDNLNQSFAGQMDSFLFISKEQDLLNSMKKCWASLYSKRALSYRNISKIKQQNISIAVIVQEMIFGEISGVMFTANPLNNNLDQIIINSTYGIGEGIVSGQLDTDSFTINKTKNTIKSEIVSKKEKISLNDKTKVGTTKLKVKKEKQKIPSLTNKQIIKLSEFGKKIQGLYDSPQDIEWTIKNNTIYILQTRPITTIKKASKKELETEDESRIIWDNSNIVESFPGLTKPLTFSFAQMAWSSVFRQSAMAMGVPNNVVKNNDLVFDNMIGLVNGRIYYNLKNWYKFVSFFPGFKNNKKYMEQMMGVKEGIKFEKSKKNNFEHIRNLNSYLRLGIGLFKNFLILDKEIAKFHKRFDSNYEYLSSIEIRQKNSKEIMNVFNNAKSKLLEGWRVEGINDYQAMVFYGMVKRLTKKYNLDESESIHNDLFCGIKDIDSTKPTKELISLALYVKNNKKYFNLFTKKDEKTILKEIENKKDYKEFKSKFNKYLDLYGYRCMSELKLEEKSLKDDPSFAIKIIQNYLKIKNLSINQFSKKELEKRKKAEKIIKQKLRYKPFKKILFFWALKNARKSVRYRENLRLCRTKAFGLIREAFQTIGNEFYKEKIINNPDDLFYLEINEIFDLIKNKNSETDIENIIKSRKQAYSNFEKQNLPERFYTNDKVLKYSKNQLFFDEEASKYDDGNILRGISCCPGIVQNTVKIIISPNDDVKLNGEILVTEKTDPGWVPLYPSVSGLLIERGSVLSHSAIVARELGLPTIVGIRGLTKKVKNGQKIKMDAGKGIVYLKNKK